MYKVLLVDDEILDLEGMKAFIPWADLGLSVVDAVNNGFAAWDILKLQRVDILVTDVRMPNMTGLELARMAIERWGDIRVIFVSGYQDFKFVKQALMLNASNYILKPMDDGELVESLQKVCEQLNQRNSSFTFAHKKILEQEGTVKPNKNRKLIRDIIRHISDHLKEDITLQDIADCFCYSPNYLGQLFKQETGKNFNEYLTLLRMERARAYLTDSNMKIYEIAYEVGYRYLPYFSRQFKEWYGMTPMQYRHYHTNDPEWCEADGG